VLNMACSRRTCAASRTSVATPKHAGLYVDLEGDTVSTPSEVQRADAVREIAVLRLSRMVSKRLMEGFDETDAETFGSAVMRPSH
jgi:hypothetical protein